MAEKPRDFKRLNRAVTIGDALGGTLDPALRKRGFASRDLITHWREIVPPPFDAATAPDKLVWPRGERRTEGAVLHLRCHPAHRLALAHEGERIAAAVNRYFGFLVVADVRIAPTPFQASPEDKPSQPAPTPDQEARLAAAVGAVPDDGLRDALLRLGRGIVARKKR